MRPGVSPASPPSPTLLMQAVDCTSDTYGQDAGKEITSRTSYGLAMLGSVDAQLRGVGPMLPPFAGSVCSGLLSSEAMDDDDWTAPRPPPAVAKLLRKYQAESVLVTAVSNGWTCVSEGPGTTSCREDGLTLVGYLFTGDQVIWKSTWRLGIAHETPDLTTGVSKLLEGAPISQVAALQSEEAPTYERALQEAGVAP